MDEADTLLEMGFREDIDAISEYLPKPPTRQTFMFSATMPTAIEQVARRILSKNHTFINCVPENAATTHLQIPQHLPHTHRALSQRSKPPSFPSFSRMQTTSSYLTSARILPMVLLEYLTPSHFPYLQHSSKDQLSPFTNSQICFLQPQPGSASTLGTLLPGYLSTTPILLY